MGKKINPDKWFEVFSGGPVTDMKGNPHDGDHLINKMVSYFSEFGADGKLVIGHPEDEKINYGSVDDLKVVERDGKNWLMVKPKEVDASFAQQVNNGWFPGRSISVEPSGKLNHVGFFPQNVPVAVQGQLPAQFQQGENDDTLIFSLSYTVTMQRNIFQRLRDWFIKEKGVEEADNIIPQYALDDMLAEELRGDKTEEVPLGFSKEEDDLTPEEIEKIKQDALKEGIEKGKRKAAAQFAAQEAERAKELADRDTEALIDKKIADGKWKPAIKPLALSFMKGLDHAHVLEFAETGGKVTKETQREQAVRLIDALTDPMPTAEFAGQKKEDEPLDKNDAGELLKKAKTYQFQQAKLGNEVDINKAMQHVVTGGKK